MPATKKPRAKTLALVKATPTPIQAYEPYDYNAEAHSALPFSFDRDEGDVLCNALDDITLAAEAGRLTNEHWVAEIFKTPKDFHAFLEELEGCDDCYRISDRWWQALARLAGRQDNEEGFIRSEDISHSLREAAAETGQL